MRSAPAMRTIAVLQPGLSLPKLAREFPLPWNVTHVFCLGVSRLRVVLGCGMPCRTALRPKLPLEHAKRKGLKNATSDGREPVSFHLRDDLDIPPRMGEGEISRPPAAATGTLETFPSGRKRKVDPRSVAGTEMRRDSSAKTEVTTLRSMAQVSLCVNLCEARSHYEDSRRRGSSTCDRGGCHR